MFGLRRKKEVWNQKPKESYCAWNCKLFCVAHGQVSKVVCLMCWCECMCSDLLDSLFALRLRLKIVFHHLNIFFCFRRLNSHHCVDFFSYWSLFLESKANFFHLCAPLNVTRGRKINSLSLTYGCNSSESIFKLEKGNGNQTLTLIFSIFLKINSFSSKTARTKQKVPKFPALCFFKVS